MIRYHFRSPVFPLICDVEGVLVGASSSEELEQELAGLDLPTAAQLPVIDASAEGWVLGTDHLVISPLTLKKRWTKKEVVTLYNSSNADRG